MNQQPKTVPQGLEDAFHTFNQLSVQLADSYAVLETQVAQLNQELATVRQQRSQEFSEKERLANRLASLLEALPGGVVVLDGQGLVQDHNPAACAFLGEPLGGIAWVEVIQRAFAPRSDDGHEISLVDGRRVSISTCPLSDDEPGQILLITDVTEMRGLQDRLNQQQRLAAMGEVAASLAHQIRTPLSSALLYISNLKRPDLSTAERLLCGEKILSRLRHLEKLVNDMLLYARNGHLGDEEFSTNDLLRALVQTIDPQLQTTHTRFGWHDETNGQILHGNQQMIISALVNLATNAMQAMEMDGHLQVVARYAADDAVDLLIIDNGPGIPKQVQEKVFEPFYTTRTDGTGLGLAVVSAIAQAHQGKAWLESTSPEGSTFVLRLPTCPARQNKVHLHTDQQDTLAVMQESG